MHERCLEEGGVMSQPLAKKTDSEIQQDVLRELKWDTRVEETDVGVEVDGGVVTLSGTVSSWGRRHAAAEAAHRVRGVLDVANDIVVKTPGTPGFTDTEVAQAVRHALAWDVFGQVADRPLRVLELGQRVDRRSIEQALARRAEREGKRISFEVCGGSVRISGTVRSSAEKEAVLGAAMGTPGVCVVEDRVHVDPSR
jgi:osmotically-inducible protein OsmY